MVVKVTERSNNFAVTSSDLSDALERSATVLANSGTSFEEFLGLVTAGTEITRNADKVSNGLKTISLRLQGMTDEGEEDLELMAKLGDELGKIGVQVQDAEGNLRSTYDILKDLSVAFETLTVGEKAYYTELISGKYQASIATAILSNFQSAVDATSTALDSNGSALRENAAYLESVAGKMSVLESEFQKLSYNTVNSNLIKGIVDLGTGVLKLINNLGGLTPVLLAVTSILLQFKKEKFNAVFKEFAESIEATGNPLKNFTKNFSTFIASVKSGNGVISSASTLVGGLGGALGIASAALAGVTAIIGIYNAHQEKLRMEAESTLQEYTEYADSLESVKEQYLSIIDSTASYSEKQEKLAELRKTLIDQFGLEEEAVKNLNLAREDGVALLDEEIKKLAEKTLAETGSEYRKAKKAIEQGSDGVDASNTYFSTPIPLDAAIDVDEFGNVTSAVSAEIDKLTKKFDFLNYTVSNTSGQYFVDFNIASDDMKDKVEKLTDVVGYLEKKQSTMSGLTDTESEALRYLSAALQDANDVLSENSSIYDQYNEALATSIKASEEFSIANIKNQESFEKWKDSLLEAAGGNEAVREILEEYIKEVAESLNYTEESAEAQRFLAESLEESTSKLEDIQNKYSTLAGAVEEYNENGSITYDTLNKLLALDAEYLDMLDMQNGKLVLNTENLKKKEQELKNNAILSQVAALGAEINAIMMQSEAEEADNAKVKLDDLEDAMERLAEGSREGALGVAMITGGLKELNTVLSNDPNYIGLSSEQEAAIEKAAEDTRKRIDMIKSFSMSLSHGSKSSSGGSKGSKGSSKEKDPIAEENKKFKEQVEILEHELFVMEKLGASEDERIKKLKELQELVHSQAEWNRAHGEGEDSQYIRDLQKQYWGYADDIKSIEEEITKKNSEAFKERLELSEQYVEDKNFYDNWGADNEIDAWKRVLKWMKEDYFDKGLISWEEYSEAVRDINKKIWEAQQEAAEKAIEAQKEALENQKSALEDQQSALEATFSYMADRIQEEIDALEEQKKQIEDYYDKEIEKIKEKNEEQDKANEKLEKENALKEAQEALERAKSQKTMRVYYEGVGWQWEADREAVSDAEQAVEDAQKDLEELEREEALEAEIERLEKLKEEALANIDEQIEGWEKYKEEWSSVADKYKEEQDRLLAEQVLGIELEGENWKSRLDNLQDYANQYIDILKQIEEAQKRIDAITNSSSSGSSSGGSSGGGGGGRPSSSNAGSKPGSINDGKVTVTKPGYPGEVSVDYDPDTGRVTSDGLKPGDVVHTQGGDFEITGGTGGNYTSKPVGKKKSYASGGIVDYTGNASVHGTSTKPEVMLNNSQATKLYNWIRNISPRFESSKLSGSSLKYDFSGAVFNITTAANSFDSLVKDIKIKVMNR